MQAIVHRRYGPPLDVLKLEEIDKPVPGDGEVRIRIRAASLNPLDRGFITGQPFPLRLMRKMPVPGADAAGEVEAVGANVTSLNVGDAVFGTCRSGSLAEYGCATAAKLARKPAALSFEEAAAMPVAASTALQGLRDHLHVQAGQSVLINGGSGGVGTFAVQIAKAFGAVVTGVCSARNVELVRGLGADRVVDYTAEDFTGGGARYDAIFDLAGNRSFSELRRVLAPNGIVVAIGAGVDVRPRWGRYFFDLATSRFRSQTYVAFMAKIRSEDLIVLSQLAGAGKIKPAIDRRYPLREAAEAAQYQFAGHARGKVIVTI
jgi:NADPH:quinone reductase-like Zn-dependent oxidoreductase